MNLIIPFSLIFLQVILFFAVGPYGSFPLNDDCIYSVAALKTAASCHFTVLGPETAWAIPQTVLSAFLIKVFGFSHFKLRLLSLLAASAGILGFDRLLLLKNVDNFSRVMSGLCLIGFFPYLALSTSYMTDIYFFFLWIYTCLTFELALISGNKRTWIFASLLLLVCALERQFGILVGLSLVIYAFRSRTTALGKAAASLLISLIGLGLTAVLWNNASIEQHAIFQNPDIKQRIGNIFCILLYFGISVSPLLPISEMLKQKALRWRIILAFFLLACGTIIIAPWNFRGNISSGTMPFFGNLLSLHGVFMENEVLSGVRQVLFGRWFWVLYTFFSVVGATLIVTEASRSALMIFKNSSVTVIASFLYIAAVVITRNPLFDRYLLPVFPALLYVLISSGIYSSARNHRALAICMVMCLILFSALIAQDFFRWNEAKWRAADWAADQGYPPYMIDGGYEWNNWHRFLNTPPDRSVHLNKVIISFSELEGTIPLKSFKYKSWIREGVVFCLHRT